MPGGRLAKKAFVFLESPCPPVRHCGCGSAGPGAPPSIISPRTVVFPSRNGSESARSILRGRPPTSVLLRFRTADNAVS